MLWVADAGEFIRVVQVVLYSKNEELYWTN